MSSGHSLALVGSLVGDPSRAAMLAALMGGKALTATELAAEAGVSAPTASGHLGKLLDGGLVLRMRQGRHGYFRIAGPDIAEMIEGLMSVSRSGGSRARTGPRDAALRRARACYDHLAGEVALRLADGLVTAGHLAYVDGGFVLGASGRRFFCDLGIDLDPLERQRRPLCRACLDWSERRPHLGGALGAALFQRFQDLAWLRRAASGRGVHLTPKGDAGMRRWLETSERASRST